MRRTKIVFGVVAASALTLIVFMCIGAYHLGSHFANRRDQSEKIEVQEQRSESVVQLIREAQRDGFLNGLDPQDASIWSALVQFAELDELCNALPECTESPVHITRPITVATRSRHGDVMFIAVLGIETWTLHGRMLVPRSTFYYYVGDRVGALWRMRPGATHCEIRDSRFDEWRFEPASDWVLNEARTAFINEWQHRLATQHDL